MKASFLSRLFFFLIIGLILFGFNQLSAQVSLNMNLLGTWDDNGLPVNSGVTYNDIWGYEAAGREYAIIGTITGTYFFDITVPASPVQVHFEAGAFNNTIWRDFKTYGNYAYGVADAGASTLQIFDLSGLPVTVTKVYDSNVFFARAHNIFIEESSGRMYAAGSNTNSTGIKVFDIATDPANPILIGNPNLGKYSHDIFVRNDTAWCFMGNSNGYEVWDFTDPASPNLLGNLNTYPEQGYCHAGWLTDSGNELIFTDETHNTGIKIADVSDPSSMSILSVFRSTLLAPAFTNSIPHNVFVKGGYLYISYYHDGVQVYDISDPSNPFKAAFYDTEPGNVNYAGYAGSWGVYPYLPSGLIIASDVKNGLFILGITGLFPVEYGEFRAAEESGEVILDWSTLSEVNNMGFEITRSEDGVNFEKIGWVASRVDAEHENFYQFRDLRPLQGTNHYQLKQMDLDGKAKYSEVLTISLKADFGSFKLFPVPVTAGCDLAFKFELGQAGMVTAELFDCMGRKTGSVQQLFSAGKAELSLATTTLSAGTYLARLSGPHTTINRKVVVFN